MSNDQSKKRESAEDFWIEFCVSVAQTAIFFFLAFFSTDFLRNEDLLQKFMDKNINSGTWEEFWLTILSVVVVTGIVSIVSVASKKKTFLSKITERILLELPRLISVFGSSVFAVFLAITVHLFFNPDGVTESIWRFAVIGSAFWFAAFIYSFFFRVMFTGASEQETSMQSPAS